MKIIIASDLHGSAYYVEKLMQRIEEEKPDQIILLGDLLYHGPRNALPKDYSTVAAAGILNQMTPAPLCIRGNCDGEVDQMMLRFPVLSEQGTMLLDGRRFFLTHGHRREELKPLLQSGDVVLFGHTHVPCADEQNGVLFINPGSVSIPKEDSPHSYLVYESGEFLWKDVETAETYKKRALK